MITNANDARRRWLRVAIKHGALWAAAAAATSAVAEEYSLALGARGQRAEIAYIETDVVGIDATYYFPPIDDTRGPYLLAPFLSRSSRVTVAAHRDVETARITSSSPFTGTTSTTVLDTETEGGWIFGRYVLPSSGWYAGGSYRTGGGGPRPSTLTRTDIDIEGYSLHVGKYVGASTSLELAWDTTESTSEFTFTGCISYPICQPLGGTHISESDAEEASVGVFHVGHIGRLAYSVSGSAASRRTERRVDLLPPPPPAGYQPAPIAAFSLPPNLVLVSNPPQFGIGSGTPVADTVPTPLSSRVQAYSAAFEVFPTASVGVGVGYSRWSGNTTDDDAYSLSVDWFFLRNVAAGVRIARTNRTIPLSPLNEVEDVGLRLTGRF